MTDIVERLQAAATSMGMECWHGTDPDGENCCMYARLSAFLDEAADEIERLEGELRSLRAENYTLNAHLGVYKSWHGHWPRLTREELDEAIAKLPEGRS